MATPYIKFYEMGIVSTFFNTPRNRKRGGFFQIA
jgi:hypothetical protein